MANEAYDRLKRCIRTREAGIRMIRAAQVTDQKAVPLACPPRAAARVAMLGSPLPVRSHPGGPVPSSATASISSRPGQTVTSTGRLRVPQHIGERLAQDGHHLASDGGRDHGVHGTLEAHLRHESQLRANLGGK